MLPIDWDLNPIFHINYHNKSNNNFNNISNRLNNLKVCTIVD